ncbi:unnamed protein product (macronuclear) [Paramecium tetraurelia]|uniref:CSC1/OSCA1-like cytosolic domain-containing protein n=1 Tax=Paramecium tetraurelia TaxID=5888 RepID=A0DKT4_PARTE|nr:uncharacterized protein GSPATT00017981001 [Paramecium tetraurelia]CAK83651.1 unnamed protein product [Paramecium tetraurelia]|eukprot:XP_001451048.1 hypothetical protein (macronuclear) [Paramecium tetraurelia strain d4-2]
MEEKNLLDIGTQALPTDGFQKHYFSPNLQQAKLHGVQFFLIKESFQIDSQRCQCCNSHLIQDYFNLFCNIKEFKHNRAAYLYFLQLQQFIFLFCISSVIFLPYALYFNSQGDQCEKMKNCIPSYYNKFSIWNQTQDYFQLDDFYLQTFYLLTIFLSSIGVYLMIFGNQYKSFLSNSYSRAVLLQSVMTNCVQNKEMETLQNHSYIKVHSLDKFQESIQVQAEGNYVFLNLDNQCHVLEKAIFQEKINPQLIQQGTIIIFPSENEKICFQTENTEIIVPDGVQSYITQNHAKTIWEAILKIFAIVISALVTILSLALNVYIQANYLNSKSTLGEGNFLKILFQILLYLQMHISSMIAKRLLHHNNYQQIYFTFQVIGFKNINRLFYPTTNQEAYLQENGIIDNLIVLCYLNILLPNLITIFDFKYLSKQFNKLYMRRYQKNNLAQIEINKFFEARQLSFEQKQYNVFQICLIGQIFIIDLPLIAPIIIIALCTIYWIDKFIFVKNCIPFQNSWGDDNALEIQKQQFLLFYIMYCLQNFFFFNNPILIFGMLGYIILFKVLMTRKLEKKIFQNKQIIKPEKLKEYASQYDPVHTLDETQHIKHQYLFNTFKILKKHLQKKCRTVRTQIQDLSD